MMDFKFICFITALVALYVLPQVEAKTLRLGVMRVPSIDPPDRLTGVMVAADKANRNNLIPNGNVSVQVFNYPHCNTTDCDFSDEAKASGMKDFLGNLSSFHAVLLPYYEISDIIIDQAKLIGLPVIDPNTVRAEDQNATHVLLFEHTVGTQISAMVRYMYMAHSCARVGIIHDNHTAYARTVTNSIVLGGYATPAVLSLPATNAQLLNMFFGEANQKCLFFLCNSVKFKEIIRVASSDSRYEAAELKLFGWSQIYTANFKFGNSSRPFGNLYYPKMIPPLAVQTQLTEGYKAATSVWANNLGPSRDGNSYMASDTISTLPTMSGIMWYTRALYTINLFAEVSIATDLSNVTQSRSRALQVAKSIQVNVEGFPFFPPVRECKPAPFTDSACACSVVNRAVYLFGINETTGDPINLVDRPLLGERSLTQFAFAQETCTLPLTITSFPFRLLLLMKVGVSQSSEDAKTEGQTDIEKFFYSFVAANNLADPAPIRPFRLITASFPTGTTAVTATNASLTHEKNYDPFVIVASVYPLTKSRKLVFMSNAGASNVEDPVLTSRVDGWDEKSLLMQPSLADYIHAVALYYSTNAARFTSLFIIAITEREARLIIKSLNSYQISVTTSFVYSSDTAVWEQTMRQWITVGGAKPFIFASALGNLTLCTALYKFIPTLGSVQIGLAGTESMLDSAITAAGLTSFPSTDVDIITGSVFTELWTPNNVYTALANQLGVNVGIMSVTNTQFALLYLLALQLSKQSIDSTTSAAELLYTAQTVSVADIPLGPFYNKTCSQGIVDSNEVDRTCQCKKALRQIRLHSFHDRFYQLPSTRTNGLVYYQTTCGVKYTALVVADTKSSKLSTGALVGIVLGSAVFVLIALSVGICLIAGMTGRNNTNAPKDSAHPFAIVFTDIQASTTLWSRTPAVMSDAVEHHCIIIRKLLSHYNGYEVKTIGDSFMMAFESLENAVTFSVKLQEAFYDAAWPEEIDQHYREILVADAVSRRESEIPPFGKQDATAEYPGITLTVAPSGPPNAPSDEAKYDSLWHGIRVRVGLHFGHGEIRKDPTTLGFDYFGTIVNTAARVEGVGHGGQTLLTEQALEELPSDFANRHHITKINLGPQILRGLDEKIVLIQLLPTSLAGRRFPNLRLDVEKNITTTDETDGTLCTSPSLEENIEALSLKLADEYLSRRNKRVSVQSYPSADHSLNTDALDLMTYSSFMNATFATSSDRWKKDTIQHLCRRWNVPNHSLNTVNQRLQAIMGIAVRVMATLKKSSNPHRRGIYNSTNATHSETTSQTSQVQPFFVGRKESITGHSGQRTFASNQLLATSHSEQFSMD